LKPLPAELYVQPGRSLEHPFTLVSSRGRANPIIITSAIG
jgi:hypothetical protein